MAGDSRQNMVSAAVALSCLVIPVVGLTTAVMPGAATHIPSAVRIRAIHDVSPVR